MVVPLAQHGPDDLVRKHPLVERPIRTGETGGSEDEERCRGQQRQEDAQHAGSKGQRPDAEEHGAHDGGAVLPRLGARMMMVVRVALCGHGTSVQHP